MFGEMFAGEYRTADDFSMPASAGGFSGGVFHRNAHGRLETYGGGLFFQYRRRLAEAIAKGVFAAWIPGPHVEATVHAGWSVLDFETEKDGAPSRFGDRGTPYVGASLGGGHVFEATPRIGLDLYGYGRWVRQGGRNVRDNLGQDVELAAADSLRIALGVRAAWREGELVRPYAGLAAEWEALGKPGARIDGYTAKRASLSGVSGLIELGVGIKTFNRVYIDLKATGSVGKRRGIGGVMEVRYAF